MKLLPLIAALYVISPVDLVPDLAPVIGWLDDVGIVALVMGIVWRAMRRYAATQGAPAGAQSAGAQQPVTGKDGVVDTAGVEL